MLAAYILLLKTVHATVLVHGVAELMIYGDTWIIKVPTVYCSPDKDLMSKHEMVLRGNKYFGNTDPLCAFLQQLFYLDQRASLPKTYCIP